MHAWRQTLRPNAARLGAHDESPLGHSVVTVRTRPGRRASASTEHAWFCLPTAEDLFPSLHHRKEGWLRHQENFAKPPKLTQPRWFSFCAHRKTSPPSRSADAARNFISRSSTPPCFDARRGLSLVGTTSPQHFQNRRRNRLRLFSRQEVPRPGYHSSSN